MTHEKYRGDTRLGDGPWLTANELLAFVVELVALVAIGRWGFVTGDGYLMKIVLGLGSPMAAIVVWGLFASPKAALRPSSVAGVLFFKALVLGASVWAVWDMGHHAPAAAFAVVIVANTVMLEVARGR